jgi:hypothetical protein
VAVPSGLWKVAILEKPADLAQPIGQESRRSCCRLGSRHSATAVFMIASTAGRPPRRAGSPPAARNPTQVFSRVINAIQCSTI